MAEEQQPQVVLPNITFYADGPNEEIRQANLDAVLPSPGFPETAFLIADAITKRAENVLLDYTRDNVATRFQIDGVWHSMPDRDRQSGDYMLATLKKLANLNYQERRARQEGEFGADFQRATTTCTIISQGVKTGERVAIHLDDGKKKLESLEDLGMRPKLVEQVKAGVRIDKGLIIVSSLPGDGSTTTWTATLNACDRFMRDYFVVEELNSVEPEVINIESRTYDRAKGETVEQLIPKLLLREPDVLAFSEPLTTEMIEPLCDLVLEHDALVLCRVHARSAVEALLRVLLLKPPVEKFTQALSSVVYSRTIRLLCEGCKQPYQPPAELLTKLGLPPGRIETLYREFQPPPPEQMVDASGKPIVYTPCIYCQGLGYRGRTAFFEHLRVTDPVRQALNNKPSLDSVTAAAKQSGHISLKEEGIVVVAKGATSISELQRVLKK